LKRRGFLQAMMLAIATPVALATGGGSIEAAILKKEVIPKTIIWGDPREIYAKACVEAMQKEFDRVSIEALFKIK